MKFEEKIQLENYAAQLHSILGNIVIANSELEKVLEQRERAMEEIESAENRFLELGDETRGLSSQRAKINDAIRKAADKIKDLQKLEKETIDFLAASKSKREGERANLEERIGNAKRTLITLQEEKAVNEQSVSVLGKQVSGLSKDIVDLSKELKNHRAKKDTISSLMDAQHILHSKDMKDRAKELARIQVEIEKSRGKVLDADAHFADREKSISRREKDVLVVTKRLRELFQEVKPGIALKI